MHQYERRAAVLASDGDLANVDAHAIDGDGVEVATHDLRRRRRGDRYTKRGSDDEGEL
jgi:hypothetical protein